MSTKAKTTASAKRQPTFTVRLTYDQALAYWKTAAETIDWADELESVLQSAKERRAAKDAHAKLERAWRAFQK